MITEFRDFPTPQNPSSPASFSEVDWKDFVQLFESGNSNFELLYGQYFNCNSTPDSPGPTREYWFRTKSAADEDPYLVLHVHFKKGASHIVGNPAETFKWITQVNARWSIGANLHPDLLHKYCKKLGRSIGKSGLNLTGKHKQCWPRGGLGSGWAAFDTVEVEQWVELTLGTNTSLSGSADEQTQFRAAFANAYIVDSTDTLSTEPCVAAALDAGDFSKVGAIVLFHITRSAAGDKYNALTVKKGKFKITCPSFASVSKISIKGDTVDVVTVTNSARLPCNTPDEQTAFRKQVITELFISDTPAACNMGDFSIKRVMFKVERSKAGKKYKKKIADKNGELGPAGPFRRVRVVTAYQAAEQGWDYEGTTATPPQFPPFLTKSDGSPNIGKHDDIVLATTDALKRILLYAEVERARSEPSGGFDHSFGRGDWRGKSEGGGGGGGGGGEEQNETTKQ
jgi:hypothetical protein